MNPTMKIKVERGRESVGLRPVQPGVALDKNEGVVKAQNGPAMF